MNKYEMALEILRNRNKLKPNVINEQCNVIAELIEKSKFHSYPAEKPKVGQAVIVCCLILGKKFYTICDYTEDGFRDGVNPAELINRTVIAWKLNDEYGGK